MPDGVQENRERQLNTDHLEETLAGAVEHLRHKVSHFESFQLGSAGVHCADEDRRLITKCSC